jgi:NADPH:quinone reductase
VLASGLEYTDVVIRRHLYPQTMHRRPPFVLGYDVVGEIDQLGDGVRGFDLGDRVADMTVLGSNAARISVAGFAELASQVASASALIQSTQRGCDIPLGSGRIWSGSSACWNGRNPAAGRRTRLFR